jgi:hypothetical protein
MTIARIHILRVKIPRRCRRSAQPLVAIYANSDWATLMKDQALERAEESNNVSIYPSLSRLFAVRPYLLHSICPHVGETNKYFGHDTELSSVPQAPKDP